MSRAGRGGGNTGVRAVASALGIARHEIGKHMQKNTDPPPLYPPTEQSIISLNETPELLSMVDVKGNLLNRFHLSQMYQTKRGPKEISRYTDKYQHQKPSDPFEPDFSRLPVELNWKEQALGRKAAKIRKLNDTNVEERIAKLEQNAEKLDQEQDPDIKKEQEDEESDAEIKAPVNEEDENEWSDEDHLEEANDYIANYFDNGEEGGDSEDNLEDGNVY